MQFKKQRLLLATFVSLVLFQACKKNDVTNNSGSSSSTTSASAVKDSSLTYSKDIYLWYNQIPSTFNAQSYSDPSAIMTAIRQYSIEPGFSTPVDRWSFGMKQTDWNNLSNGVSSDFGMDV